MVDLDIIRKSDYPYTSPIVIVKKPDRSNRFCVDYWKLNKITVFDPKPMPTTEELSHKISNDKFFSKVDLRKRYRQIEVSEEDIHKTLRHRMVTWSFLECLLAW
ncbi:hypothetical protein RRG08_034925 [Elysia crispata]|uniref:Reverse transcriptase domain-containing protein n=1 Tax=Elysia crispata TaxID=231223 RepID=A0AAE0Y202_9GAST|nr:hypothetical protein RRG08_034925 [Elysia crispata]